MQVVPVVVVDDLSETDEADVPTQELLAAATRYAEGEFADAGLIARLRLTYLSVTPSSGPQLPRALPSTRRALSAQSVSTATTT